MDAGLSMIRPKMSFLMVALIVLINNNAGYEAKTTTTAEQSTGREASLQAYGLPKRLLTENGYIVRMRIDNNVTAKDSSVDNAMPIDKRRFHNLHQSRILPSNDEKTSGTIERIQLANPINGQMSRNSRSIERNSEITQLNNMRIEQQDDDLLEADETKVFRPLFVYRQQVAAKRARSAQRDKKIIAKKSKNSLHYYKF